MIPPPLKNKFTEEMVKKWNFVVNLSCLCLMYHSDIIEDAFDFTMGMYNDDPDKQKYEEKLKVIWKYANSIIKWIQNSLQGEKHFMVSQQVEGKSLLEETVAEMNGIIEKTWAEKEEKIRKEKEESAKKEEERKKLDEERIKKAEKDREEEEKKKEGNAKGGPSSANLKVSVSGGHNKAKKRNRKKLINQVIIPKQKRKNKKEEEKEHEKEEDDKKSEKIDESTLIKEEKPLELSDME